MKPASVCICALLPRVKNRTHIHILQHPREQHRPIGTVRFAQLGLANCAVEVNHPAQGIPSRLAQLSRSDMALLFPSPHARPIEALPLHDRPQTLVVLDGTWHQVKALVKNNPWLHELPHLMLATPEPSRYRIRREPQVHYLSTLEAIVATLAALEPETQGFSELLQAFDAMIDTQIERSAVRRVRHWAPKPPKQKALPLLLTQKLENHVLLRVETIGPGRAARPIQVCAWRLATNERFECVIAHDPETDRRKRHKLQLPDALPGVNEAAFFQQWSAFVRTDDVLLAWNQRSLDLLGTPECSVLVKAVWCNLRRSQAGHLTDVLAREGLVAEKTDFAGVAAQHMGALKALTERLTMAAPFDAALAGDGPTHQDGDHTGTYR